ncbi:MAG TPA: hypothetical protein VGS00_04480 [Thermoanaerobaculia bacterium]|nr:hypothetical protein [Thermoanaerobaculia bacterium]
MFKRTEAPRATPSVRMAVQDLRLHRLDIIHAGHETFPLEPRIRAVALQRVLQDVKPLP